MSTGHTNPLEAINVPSGADSKSQIGSQASTQNVREQMPVPDKAGASMPGPGSLTEVITVFEFYRDEAAKCAEAEACLGGCVFLASALEASLLAMTRCFPEEVAHFVESTSTRGLSRPPKDWGLSQLLLVARGLGWLPNSENEDARLDPTKAKVGDLVDVVRVVRNLIHPAIYLREYPGEQLDWKALEVSFRILDASCSCLAAKLEDAMELMTTASSNGVESPSF